MTATLRSFDKSDRTCFNGCEDPNALIAELGAYVVIVDGSMLTIFKKTRNHWVERFADHGTKFDAVLAATDLVNLYDIYGDGIELYRAVCGYAGNIR